MEFQFTGTARITMSHSQGETSSKLEETDFYLDVSDNLDESQYLDKEGLPTALGSQALTGAFIMGLIGNIHMAHENGFRDSAEHLKYIISKLEEGFVLVPEISKGKF